jgi:hypothetical protein
MLAMLSVQDAGMMGLISLKSAGTKRGIGQSHGRDDPAGFLPAVP